VTRARVLVVDDHEDVRRTVVRLLEVVPHLEVEGYPTARAGDVPRPQ